MPSLRPIAILAGSCVLALSAPVWAQTRDAETILADLSELQLPHYDAAKREDREYVGQYIQARNDYLQGRAALALELYKANPEHPQVAGLMAERWSTLSRQRSFDEVLAETAAVAEGKSEFATDAAYHHAMALGSSKEWDLAATAPVIDAFIARAPGDERGASLLGTAARYAKDAGDQMKLYRRMATEFPEARASRYAAGKINQLEGMGKPFELEFQDAVNGETVSVLDSKGTIFVIDFWATWCGPCIAEMPHMKELYAEYNAKGVEFIGVSLDQPEASGGLEKLLAYVKDNEIAWPQYYQGAGWDSEFSTSWGINAIPSLFVVDADGNLHSTEARGKLEKLLPELIAKRDAKH